MSGALATFLLTWLLWWAVLSAAYAAVLFIVESAITAWQRHHDERRRRLEDEAQVAHDVAAAVQRIGSAYLIAQRQIHNEAAENRSRVAVNSESQQQNSLYRTLRTS